MPGYRAGGESQTLWGVARFDPESRNLAVPDKEQVRVLSLPDIVERSTVLMEGENGLAVAFARALNSWQGSYLIDENKNQFERSTVSVLGVATNGAQTPLGVEKYLDYLTYSAGAVLVIDGADAESNATVNVTSWDRSGVEPHRIGQTTASGSVPAAAISSEGRYAAIVNAQGGYIIDLKGDQRITFAANQGRGSLTAFAFTGHDSILVQHVLPQREEDTLRNRLTFWDRASGDLIGEWEEPLAAAVSDSISFQLVAIGDNALTIRPDGAIAVWKAEPKSWARALCALVGEPSNDERQRYLDRISVGPLCQE